MENKVEIDIVIMPEGKGKDKFYSISSMQFPNIVTQGDTIEQAKKRLREALELYFEEVPQEKEILIKIKNKNNLPLISRMFL